MALKLRNGTYWIDVQIKGVRIRETLRTGDKKQAQAAHDLRRAELWRGVVIKEKPRKTFAQACERWLVEKAGKKSIETDILRIAIIKPKLGATLLTEITKEKVERLLPKEAKPATRNRYRALIRAILRACERDWEWIDKAPFIKAERESNKRETFLTREQAEALLENLMPKYRAAVRFAMLTGLRRANVLGLRWDAVNLETATAKVDAEEAKGGKQIIVPLNESAVALLEELPHREGSVFGIGHISRSVWQTACKKAGVPDFRFHDLRHTWASWHAQAGTPIQVLQELGGWASHSMVQRYVAFAPQHLANAARAVSI
jgi:integrase